MKKADFNKNGALEHTRINNKETIVTGSYNFKSPKNIKILLNLKSVFANYQDSKISYYKLMPKIVGTPHGLDSLIVDKYFKGSGVLTKSQMIIYSTI